MYRLLVLIFLLSACSLTEEDPTQIDYGEYMFPMSCLWDDGNPNSSNDSGTIVYCYAHDITSEIIEADFFSLSVQYPENADERVKVCGENLNLYSGHSLYDSILPIITNNQFGCINAFDRIKNDEFDWFWYNKERILEFQWRPENNLPLEMYLVVEEPEYGQDTYINGYSSKAVIYLKKELD